MFIVCITSKYKGFNILVSHSLYVPKKINFKRTDLRFQSSVVAALQKVTVTTLQEAAAALQESICIFSASSLLRYAIHARRVTIMPKDNQVYVPIEQQVSPHFLRTIHRSLFLLMNLSPR